MNEIKIELLFVYKWDKREQSIVLAPDNVLHNSRRYNVSSWPMSTLILLEGIRIKLTFFSGDDFIFLIRIYWVLGYGAGAYVCPGYACPGRAIGFARTSSMDLYWE